MFNLAVKKKIEKNLPLKVYGNLKIYFSFLIFHLSCRKITQNNLFSKVLLPERK